jgi:hypothetical protein
MYIVISPEKFERATFQPKQGSAESMSKVTIKRVLIPDETFEGSAILKALQEMLHEVLQDSALRQCVLYIPTKGALQGTTLEGALGTKASKALLSNKRFPLESSFLRLETDASFKGYTPCDAVVVIYADQKMMDKVDSNPHPKLVICVPRLLEAVDSWKRSWGPITPNKPQEDFELIGNKVVEAALLSMTSRINLGNQVLSSLDQESVKDAFRILRAHRQTEDPGNIRAWCIKHGWHAEAADEAVKYAIKAFGLASKPSQYGRHWATDIYEQWVEGAAKG